jgi:hypothetical protein
MHYYLEGLWRRPGLSRPAGLARSTDSGNRLTTNRFGVNRNSGAIQQRRDRVDELTSKVFAPLLC